MTLDNGRDVPDRGEAEESKASQPAPHALAARKRITSPHVAARRSSSWYLAATKRGQRWLPSFVERGKRKTVEREKSRNQGFGVKRQSADTLTLMVCWPGLIWVSTDCATAFAANMGLGGGG
jgi:hypothetical protein